ncbi:MAG: hypothetical protein HZC41_12860 [Chloroflexi bacterium]|nr:hypothetical protein [Chloroflexota bacterium]
MSDNRPADDQWEAFVRDTARDFPYPPTPDILPAVRQPAQSQLPRRTARWRLAAAVVLSALVAALAVPEVRAAVLEVLRIGAVRIFLVEPPVSTATPAPTVTPGTPAPVLNLPGETSLELARARLKERVRLPAELGDPDRVFLQYLGGPVLTLVWLAADDPNTPEWVLQILDRDVSASKEMYRGQPRDVTVNGRPGVWLEDVHEIVFYRITGESRRLVEAHVLVWEINGITYRLETTHALADALRVAESVP